MNELTDKFREEFKDKETRRIYVDDFLNTSIATQLKVLREQRGLTQAQLAELAGMRQERISVLEDVNYSAWTINVLRRLAEALDLRLSVKFESFGSFIHEFETFDRTALEKPSFDDDPEFHGIPRTTGKVYNFIDSNTLLAAMGARGLVIGNLDKNVPPGMIKITSTDKETRVFEGLEMAKPVKALPDVLPLPSTTTLDYTNLHAF